MLPQWQCSPHADRSSSDPATPLARSRPSWAAAPSGGASSACQPVAPVTAATARPVKNRVAGRWLAAAALAITSA
jgi:hypothetical protein